jgi:hexosaminidase
LPIDTSRFDPFLGGEIPKESQNLVLGGMVLLWTENVGESVVHSKIWPRAAATAELWWTGAAPGAYPMGMATS